MNNKQKYHSLPILFLFSVTVFFFYKTFFQGLIPFPGDLLISEYKPWSTYSYLGYNPGSYPSKKQYFDTIRQIYPWRTLVNKQLKQGQLPLWNPYNFSGSPLLANIQSQVFYPLTLVYFFLNQKLGWTILIILQPFLASLFTYLYMRKIQTSIASSLLSAVAYGFSLFMTAFLEYNTIGQVMIWLPFVLLMTELLIERKRVVPMAGFVFGLVSAAFAGHLQLFGSMLLFTSMYCVFRGKSKNVLFFSFLILISLGTTAIQMLPTAELLSLSARADHNYSDVINRLLIQPKQLLMAFSPDIFGNPATNNYLLHDSYPGKTVAIGLIPIFFAFFALLQKGKSPLIKFFIITAGILLLVMTNNPITQILYHASIPFVSASAPTNNIFLLSFILSVLAGVGLDQWMKKPYIPIQLIIGFSAILIFTGMLFQLKIFAIIPKNLIFSTTIAMGFFFLLFIFFVIKKTRNLIPYLFIVITVCELWYFFQKFNPFVPAQLVYPEAAVVTWLQQHAGLDRSWGYGTANIEANYATQEGVYSPDGYDPLYPSYYGAFLASSKNGQLLTSFTDTSRSDAIVAPGYGESDFADNRYRKMVLNLLGTKYILNRAENQTTEKTFPPEEFSQLSNENGWVVLENKQVYPRAFLTSSVPSTLDLSFQPASGTAEIEDYQPNVVHVSTRSEKNSFLFLSDTYYPGWKAFVNGTETEIVKANYAFRAVPVPPGSQKVSFVYKPVSVLVGAIFSGFSILTLIATVVWMTMKKGKNV